MRGRLVFFLFITIFGYSYSQWNENGDNVTNGNIKALNANNTAASVSLSWKNNVARLRVGGEGSGSANGLDIQGPGDISLLRVFGNGAIQAKGVINGRLSHSNGYFTIHPYSSSYDDGSHAKIFYDGNNKRIRFWNSDSNAVYTDLEAGNIFSNGSVRIGTNTIGTHRLAVEGSIGAREVKVEASGWSDFVFEDDYNLPSLEAVEKYIKEKGHLQDTPSAGEVEKNGINLGEMDSKLLQKIEELTLYAIDQEKRIKRLETQNTELLTLVNKLLEDKSEK